MNINAPKTASRSSDDDSTGVRDPALRVDGLEKVYGDEDPIRAVDDVSLEVERGTVVGLLGPNGAGKTTLIKMILGLVVPDGGSVSFDFPNHEADHQYEYASAVLEGSRNVYWKLTAQENLEFFASLQGIDPDDVADYHWTLLNRFGLADRADDPVQNLSRGMKQRVAIASVLARQTPVVFLDEPTLGLDVEASQQLRDQLPKIATEDRTVIVSSHDMDIIQEVCDRVVILNDGRIVADDSVENLIDVFRSRTFRVEVSPVLSADARERIECAVAIDGWDDADGTTAFEATLAEDDRLYDLMDALRAQDATVERIDSVEPSLEDVFLHYTGEDVRIEGDSA